MLSTLSHFVRLQVGRPFSSHYWLYLFYQPLSSSHIPESHFSFVSEFVKFLEFEELSVLFKIGWDAKLYEVNCLDDFPIDTKLSSWIFKYLYSERLKKKIFPLHVIQPQISVFSWLSKLWLLMNKLSLTERICRRELGWEHPSVKPVLTLWILVCKDTVSLRATACTWGRPYLPSWSSMLHIRQSFPSKHIYFYHDKVKKKECLRKKSLVIMVAEFLPYIFWDPRSDHSQVGTNH